MAKVILKWLLSRNALESHSPHLPSNYQCMNSYSLYFGKALYKKPRLNRMC